MIITHTVLFCDFNGDMHEQRFITRQKAINFALGLIENGHATPDIYDQAGRSVRFPIPEWRFFGEEYVISWHDLRTGDDCYARLPTQEAADAMVATFDRVAIPDWVSAHPFNYPPLSA
ncbi:hypothetical protein [Celeribacter sp.]|uniref:hypothetical protein n=1 Tax=Celeribacter sp. TaxID=1890673 RepID=UPI003A8DEE0B